MPLPIASATSPNIQVAGKSSLFIGLPGNLDVMHYIGEQMDMTEVTSEQVLHDVPGDSQGGPQGDPIEQQILALRMRCNFNLSKWDPIVRDKIRQHASMATDGSFAQSEIGALLLKTRSFRIAIVPSKDTTIPVTDPITGDAHPNAGSDYHLYNFVCCTVSSPIETGQGTKFSALRFSMRAWRAPQGHALAPGSGGIDWANGLIWNKSITGIPVSYLPPNMVP